MFAAFFFFLWNRARYAQGHRRVMMNVSPHIEKASFSQEKQHSFDERSDPGRNREKERDTMMTPSSI
uniref:Putative secreted peptide n=1 Tax=Anopheles braziliensis TaxID=58242 RepID=A0A2M3ZWH9_9DIPT